MDAVTTQILVQLGFLVAVVVGQPSNASTLTPTAANWPFVAFYPPIQSVPLFVPGSVNVLQVSVNAPFCNAYAVPPGGPSGTPAFQIFCRTTFPSGLPSDLPLQLSDVVPAAPTVDTTAQGRRFEFALFNCLTLDPQGWYKIAPSNIALANTRCASSLQCYYSPNGLPLTRYHSRTQTPPNVNWPYYCCTNTSTIVSASVQGRAEIANETRCVFVGTDPSNNIMPTIGDSCASRLGMREVCTLTLSTTDLFASVVTVHDWLCDYACSWPCVSSAGGQAASLCSDASDLRGCLPSAHDLQCTRDVLIDPPYCSQTGETAHGYITTDQGLLAECDVGQFGCTAVCHCFGRGGCPNHVNCTQQGTLYESEADGVPPQCMCNPLNFGNQCQFQLPAIDCNHGQQYVVNVLNYETNF